LWFLFKNDNNIEIFIYPFFPDSVMSLTRKLGVPGIALAAGLAGSAISSTEANAQARHSPRGALPVCSWLCPTYQINYDSLKAHYDSIINDLKPRIPRSISAPQDTTRARTQSQAQLPPYIRILGDSIIRILNYESLTPAQKTDAYRRVDEFLQGKAYRTIAPRTYLLARPAQPTQPAQRAQTPRQTPRTPQPTPRPSAPAPRPEVPRDAAKAEPVEPRILPTEPTVQEIQKPLVRMTRDTFELNVLYDSLTPEQKADFEKRFDMFSRGRQIKEVSPGLYVAVAKPEEAEKEKRGAPIRLTLDGVLGENGIIGGALGGRYGPVGISLGYWQAGDVLTDSVNVELSKSRRGIGTTYETNPGALNLSGELHLWRLFLKGGINFENYTRMVDEGIWSAQGELLKPSPTKSTSESSLSGMIGGGFEIPIGKFGLRLSGSYITNGTRKGVVGGLGGSFRLNKQHRR